MSIEDKVFYAKFQFGLLERLIVLEDLLYNAQLMNYSSVSVIRKLNEFNDKANIMWTICDYVDILTKKMYDYESFGFISSN